MDTPSAGPSTPGGGSRREDRKGPRAAPAAIRSGQALRQRWGTRPIVAPAPGARRERYRVWLRRLSRAIVEAQRPIRVLKSLHWPDGVTARFLHHKERDLPAPEYAPLGYDPERKVAEFRDLAEVLDARDPLQAILRDTALQYAEVVRMLQARGTKGLYAYSCRLYGHPLEPFAGQTTTSLDLARHLDALVSEDEAHALPPGRLRTAEQTARILRKRIERTFPGARLKVEVSGLLTADAAAGSSRIRIKRGRMFGAETIDYLEQHEGYVHIATTLNGLRQPFLPVLGKASPRAVRVNEGLAVFGEWASHTMTLRRVRRLVDRVLAIRMAEEGADFLDVYHHFRERGEVPAAAFDIARRVFRGGDLRGGAPFTKDASYLGDFLRIFNFARVAARRRRMDLLLLLFAGKVTIADIPVLSRHLASGEVRRARYLPPWLQRGDWLASHMAISSFLDDVRLGATESHYEALFAQCAPPPEPEEPSGEGHEVHVLYHP